MKLRLRNNSIRLRLDQEDVKNFIENKKVTEKIYFQPNMPALSYSISWERYAEKVSAEFVGQDILINVPDKIAKKWVQDSEVGFEADQQIDGNQSLQILIEKDFKCLTKRPGEDESKSFPNPSKVHPSIS